MKPRCVIWDWNGTLLDDLQLCLRLLNEMLEEDGCPNRYDLAAYREIFGFPVVDYYRRAYAGTARDGSHHCRKG